MRGERETHTTAEESCSEETARFRRSSCFFCVDGGFSFSAVFALLCCLPFFFCLNTHRGSAFFLSHVTIVTAPRSLRLLLLESQVQNSAVYFLHHARIDVL
jgi:hypothetical protein